MQFVKSRIMQIATKKHYDETSTDEVGVNTVTEVEAFITNGIK